MKRILLVGPGLIGQRHLQLIDENPRSRLAGIVAPDNTTNKDVARKYECPFFETLTSGLAEHPDGVIISSPNEFHFDQAKECIIGHYPVLVEKPITPEYEQAVALCRLSIEYETPVLVGHHRNYSSVLRRSQSLITEGLLGKVVSVIGSAQFYKPNHYFAEGVWRTKIGGGPILINMIHEIGNLRFLCGEISSVHAFASHEIRQFEVEDTASINFRFENGALGTFIVSDTVASAMSWENTSGENKSYPRYLNNACYFISGTKGSLQVPTLHHYSYPAGTEPSWWNKMTSNQFSYPDEDPLANQLQHFIDVIEGQAAPIVSAQDGLANLLVIEAIKRSIREARPIDINSISS